LAAPVDEAHGSLVNNRFTQILMLRSAFSQGTLDKGSSLAFGCGLFRFTAGTIGLNIFLATSGSFQALCSSFKTWIYFFLGYCSKVLVLPHSG
jgi:hypothetical protein